MFELAMFAYPWDAAADGPEAMISQLSDLGVDRIEIATTYHSAETIRPRRSKDVHILVEPNVAHLPLDLSGFGELVPREGRLARERSDLFPRLARAAVEAGIKVSGWTIALHQSAMARQFPDHALENCFGDRSAHGLCPADPAVAEYAVELSAAVAGTGYFDELMLESLSYGLVGHGHPHELWATRLDVTCRLLLSLCFCPACLNRGKQAGVDGASLRQWTREHLTRLWNSPLAAERSPDNGQEAAALLVGRPDLASWVRMRCTVVVELVERISQRIAESGVSLALGSAVWARPAPLNWMEGINLAALSMVCDRIALMPYHRATADVALDLDFATSVASAARLQMLQTIFPAHHDGVGALVEKVRLARSAGLRHFGLYNLAMAPEPMLGWVRAVSSMLRE